MFLLKNKNKKQRKTLIPTNPFLIYKSKMCVNQSPMVSPSDSIDMYAIQEVHVKNVSVITYIWY